MTKKEQPVTPILTMEVLINVDDIVGFNDNLGENGKWGYYNSPFEANQFAEINFNFKKTKIPIFSPKSRINLIVKPSEKSKSHWDMRVDYVTVQ